MSNQDIMECVIMASLWKNSPEMPINKEKFIKLTLSDYTSMYNECSVNHALNELIRQGTIEARHNEIMIG